MTPMLIWMTAVAHHSPIHDFLDRRTPYNHWWRALGWYIIVASCLAVYATSKRAWVDRTRLDRLRSTFFVLYSLYAIVQVLEEVGQPVLLWRPPILAIMATLSIAIVVSQGNLTWRWHWRQRDAQQRRDHH